VFLLILLILPYWLRVSLRGKTLRTDSGIALKLTELVDLHFIWGAGSLLSIHVIGPHVLIQKDPDASTEQSKTPKEELSLLRRWIAAVLIPSVSLKVHNLQCTLQVSVRFLSSSSDGSRNQVRWLLGMCPLKS
jgi:hypothetical protein